MANKPAHILWLNGNATFCRGKIPVGDMKKYRAAAIAHSLCVIMVKNQAPIIEPVFAVHDFVAGRVGEFYRPVVIAVIRRITPA